MVKYLFILPTSKCHYCQYGYLVNVALDKTTDLFCLLFYHLSIKKIYVSYLYFDRWYIFILKTRFNLSFLSYYYYCYYYRETMQLHSLITFFTLISSANFFRSDSSINTVEEFLDTLINSSRYDRRIRPFFDQQSQSIDFSSISLIYCFYSRSM